MLKFIMIFLLVFIMLFILYVEDVERRNNDLQEQVERLEIKLKVYESNLPFNGAY